MKRPLTAEETHQESLAIGFITVSLAVGGLMGGLFIGTGDLGAGLAVLGFALFTIAFNSLVLLSIAKSRRTPGTAE